MMILNLSGCPWTGGAEQVFGCLVTAIWGNNHCTSTTRTLTTEQPLHTCTATIAHQPRHNHNALNSTAQHLIGVVHWWWVPCSVMHIYMNRSTRTMPHLGWWQERDCSRTLSESVPLTTEHISAHLSSRTSQLLLIWALAHSHLSFYSFELLLIWGSMMRWAHDSSRMPKFEKEETVTLPKQRWINQTLTVSDKTPKCTEMSSPQLKWTSPCTDRGCFATHDHISLFWLGSLLHRDHYGRVMRQKDWDWNSEIHRTN